MIPTNFKELEKYKDYSALHEGSAEVVVDPYNGLEFYELSHMWGTGVPSYPGDADVIFDHGVKHAQFGVQAYKVKTNFHTGTHLIAPIHMDAYGDDLEELNIGRFFGNGVILDLRHKSNWGKITAEDLKAAGEIREEDIVAINTGWHHKYSDSLEYFGAAPGLTEDAASYLIEKKVRLVAVDMPYVDCPVTTVLTEHTGCPGPFMRRLIPTYKEETGRDAKEDYPGFYPVHKALAKAGIPVIQQMAGAADELCGKRATMIAMPWKIRRGDACPVRFTAILDPGGQVRIDKGEAFELKEEMK